ncbi:class I SAM-dependent methyltransferase [Methylomonas sp. MgM2]|jgi:SAM-dependent methyltransferase
MSALTLSKFVPGTEGYAEDAESLISLYEGVPFTEKYKAVLHLLPTKASKILDLGAGTGIDAAWLAKKGHCILAVEPTDPLREAGARLHSSNRIEWLDDSLPMLLKTMARKEVFDIALVTAVWAHLAENERKHAMSNIAALLKPGALLIMSLRHGPTPAGRRAFEVTAEETIELARRDGLKEVLYVRTESAQPINRQAGIMWSWLAFRNEPSSSFKRDRLPPAP